MVKTRFVGLIFCCVLATSGWAETSSPTLMVTPTQPKWSDLTVPQRILLAPLSDDWDSFENFHQKKWLAIAARFPSLPQEEQRRIQKQMQEWGKLTPEQRQIARENYKAAKQLPIEKKKELKQKWEEYASLPQEEKERLKQQAVHQPSSLPQLKPSLPTIVPPQADPAAITPTPTSPAPALPVADTPPVAPSPVSADAAQKP